ncbi:MAG: hypothetical protein HS116_00590 [Planctomycetes bacterium]|nr:hypothetical protein [Planctomycetota bacterium]
MSELEESPKDRLERKFPDLVLGGGAPALFTFNGLGTMVYGRRDYDAESDTYVKTHFIVFFFVPVLALGAYRVANADNGGWYFIGKQPLSGACKMLNLAALAAVLFIAVSIGWTSYTSTPEYKATAALQKARTQREEGQTLLALQAYAEVQDSGTPSSKEAAEEAKALFAEALPQAAPADAEPLIQFALNRASLNRTLMTPEALRAEVLKLAEARGLENPRAGLALLKSSASLDPDGTAFIKTREKFLRAAIAKEPNDLDLAAELADLHVMREEWDAARALLEPHAGKLAGQEGARVLGQLYVRAGDFEKALPLLKGYATKRLEALHSAQKHYEMMRESAYQRLLKRLNGGEASKEWYEGYKRSNEETKEKMFQEWIAPRMEADTKLKASEAELMNVSGVVPVALDLGIVLLRRAQEQAGAERQASLEEAEKVFLAIGGVAGETDAYRLFYGQVLYWLGKHEEGAKLFDEFLASKQRDSGSLGQVAQVFRAVGDEVRARTLYEEAYEKADEKTKQQIAGARASLSSEEAERLLWLERCDGRGVTVQAEIAGVRARMSLKAGDETAAERYYREAIRGYESVPTNDVVLNNTAIFYLELFFLSGARSDYEKYASLVEASQKLDPDDSIVLGNAASALESSARLAVYGDRFDLRALRRVPNYGDLSLLYADDPGWHATVKPLIEHPLSLRSMEYYRRQALLAPKSHSGYGALAGILVVRDDLAGLKELEAQVERSGYTPEEAIRASLDYYKPEREIETRATCTQFATIMKRRLDALPKDAAPLTRAALLCDSIEQGVALHTAGGTPDLDEMVNLAEEVARLCPSSKANKTLLAAYRTRLLAGLAQKDAALKDYLEKHRRGLQGSQALVFLLRNPTWRGIVSSHPDFSRVTELMRTSLRAFPRSVSSTEWAFFKYAGLPEAAEVDAAWKANEILQIVHRIERRLSPLASEPLLEEVLRLEALGKKEEALALLREAVEKGVPIPKE